MTPTGTQQPLLAVPLLTQQQHDSAADVMRVFSVEAKKQSITALSSQHVHVWQMYANTIPQVKSRYCSEGLTLALLLCKCCRSIVMCWKFLNDSLD
jgi:hypothetical protein